MSAPARTGAPALCLSDAHTHPGTPEELSERCEGAVLSLVCLTCPPQAEAFLAKAARPYLIPTAGLHPWKAASFSLEEMKPWLLACPVIGEIGMDSVWCDVPLKLQEDVFTAQLELAAQWKRPVILHTKGQEKTIAAHLRRYPNRYLVHWYSCESGLEDYLALDCYFSIGPDVTWNPAVRAAAARVPANRLLIETDGMSAVRWAAEEAPSPETPPETVRGSLERTLAEVAAIRGLTPKQAEILTRQNLTDGFLLGKSV